MRIQAILRILGILLVIYSFFNIPPILVSLYYDTADPYIFAISFYTTLIIGFLLWLPNKNIDHDLTNRDGFVVAAFLWLTLSSFSAIPFALSKTLNFTLAEAFFEAVSGITTTGATVIKNVDGVSKDLLYYRQQLQFLGGMGIIVLAVAILPKLRIGGMQLYKTEITGVTKDDKITPRIASTAKALWSVYFILNLLCILAFYIAGMDLFDSVCYAFGTLSTGGFAPHTASIAYYQSKTIYIINMIFMVIAAINFSLHFKVIKNKNIKLYFLDQECKYYLIYLICVIAILFFSLMMYHTHTNYLDALLDSAYHVISISTTTGLVKENFAIWPNFIPLFIIYIGIIGASAGSTSGGIKFIRVIMLHKQGMLELKRLIHPHGKFVIKYGDSIVPNNTINSVWSFFAGYFAIYIFFLLVLIALGLDFPTAFSAIASTLGNVGPGLGAVTDHYASIGSAAQFILSLSMLLGRLEIFTILVLFVPDFWKY